MTAPSSRPSQRTIRNLDIPLTPLKARLPDSALIARVRSEFLEMRGFSPTLKQAGRLFQLASEECGRVLAALVSEGFLSEERDGRFRLSRHR